jgi:hypothetical protein
VQGGSGLSYQYWLQDGTGLDLNYSDAISLPTASQSWQPTFTAEEYFGEADLINEIPTSLYLAINLEVVDLIVLSPSANVEAA